MDYKYIEQLLERYWECQTTLEEENILRSFFAQKDVPASMLPYRDLFLEQKAEAEETLDASFDERILALTEGKEEKPKAGEMKIIATPVTRTYKLRPFLQAAACIAVFLCLGMAIQQASLHKQVYTEVQDIPSPQVSIAPATETALGENFNVPVDTAILEQTAQPGL